MQKLNTLGIGPKIGRIALPYFLLTILLSIFYKDIFTVHTRFDMLIQIIGFILLLIGLIFYAVTVRLSD